jgi:protein-S-isoprenylcysteine O-methyltransferase Ste14
METVIFPVTIIGYLVAAVVWPTVRTWVQHRVWPLVFHREADPFQRLIGALMGLLILGVIVWALLFWAVGPAWLGVWAVPPLLQGAGWSLMALGLFITLVAQRQMGGSWRIGIDDRPTELVTCGLFGYCRNPIFSGMIITLLGAVLFAPAAWSVAGFFAACSLISIQVRLEEEMLLRLHGRRYLDYASRVGRFVPVIGRLEPDRLTPR